MIRDAGTLAGLKRTAAAKAVMIVMAMLFASAAVCGAEDKETATTEEILQILKEKNIVTEAQYQELMQKAEAEKQQSEEDYTVNWNNGLNINRNDGAFKVKVGGRIQFDWGAIDSDGSLEDNESNGVYGDNDLKGNGVEFRRARLFISGSLWEDVLFKAQYDFGGGDADFKDVYIGMQNIPVMGKVLVGHMKEPFSLEEQTSSKYITFMERSLPTGAFSPSRNSGIRASNAVLDKRMTWGAGLFYGDTDDDGDSDFNDDTNLNMTVRITGLPYYADEGRRLLHLGLGYSHQFRDEGSTTARYRNRPESHLTDVRLVDTGSIDLDGADLLNPELAFVWGPFSLQGEYFWTNLDASAADDPRFQGAYLAGSWFPTGENRPYSTSSGAFGRIKPNNNFGLGEDAGIGAWELAARWSWLDLNDGEIEGGEEHNLTLGLNWYWNPNSRMMFNYIYADVEDRAEAEDGKANIFQTRFQIDF
jgi:phosphate-selective porin OprO/OprP